MHGIGDEQERHSASRTSFRFDVSVGVWSSRELFRSSPGQQWLGAIVLLLVVPGEHVVEVVRGFYDAWRGGSKLHGASPVLLLAHATF
jgi:hypothetical protein